MKCKLCNSNKVKFISKFKPYADVEWHFDIFECSNCDSRFADRDPMVNYPEIIHSNKYGPYSSQYCLANKVKYFLDNGQIDACENFLKKSHYKYEEIINFINSIKNEHIKILEVGCSTGYLTAFLRAKGFNVFGIDISKTAINSATELFGEFYGTKEKNIKYDIIFHVGLIGCVDNPKEFLVYYLSLLDKQGVMIFNAPNINNVKQLNKLWASSPPPDVIYLFSEKSFEFLIDKSSFDIYIKKRYVSQNIFNKNLSLIKNKTYSKYPKTFERKTKFYDNNRKSTFVEKAVKYLVLKTIVILSSLFFRDITKKIDDEYGLIIKVTKRGQQ
ncbi:hypothetical protein MSIBF_A640004 [groundwater metagenome]|uniref:Methyltransferase domain-containing protein n=1 Tax=groundwater metagenome TaxID=717931 RepID=A0A098ED02_9ZZZZ